MTTISVQSPIAMRNRLKELRLAKGLNQDDVGEIIGCSGQQIGRLENGERGIDLEWLEVLGWALDVKPDEILPVEWALRRIKICGIVQAGYLAEPGEEMEQPPADDYVSAPLPETYQHVRAFAVRVAGPSMNRAFSPGTILVCGLLEELHEQLETGRYYIVRRIQADGRIETTVKELAFDEEGRPWLWPRSNHPSYQQPWRADEGEPGETIEAYARVLWVMRPV